MNLHFYKGNPKITGTACSFQVYNGSLFVNFIKQFSWDESKKLGSFRENMNNPEKTGKFKFSAVEAGSIVDAINRNIEYKFYHTSPNSTAMGKFCPYINKEGVKIGYSFSVSKEQKGDTVNKTSFLIGFTFGEAVLLKQFILKYIDSTFVSQETDSESAPAKKIEPQKKPIYNKVELNAPQKAQAEAEAQAEELIF